MRIRQKGQALPFGLALLMVTSLGALVLFNTGQVAIEKQRVVDTADSAAYSGLVWQARALNFQAYTNRAMVANQVSIAQAVSLKSWAAYANDVARKLQVTLGWVPYVGALVQGAANAVRTVKSVIDPVTRGMVVVADTVNRALSASQQAMFVSSFAATPEIVKTVVAASDPDFSMGTAYSLAGIASNLNDWRTFTEKHNGRDMDAMAGRLEVINASRDPFTQRRDWSMFTIWLGLSEFKMRREGSTRLVLIEKNGRATWEWVGKDTLSLHEKRLTWTGTKRHEQELGWAAANAKTTRDRSQVVRECRKGSGKVSNCRWTDHNRDAEKAADTTIRSAGTYSGVQAFRTLSESALRQRENDPVLRLRIEVTAPTNSVRTSAAHVNGKHFNTDVVAPGDKLSSISVAEVYYRRPDAYGSKTAAVARQAANGYNPYWDVRLAPISLKERLAVVALNTFTGGSAQTPPALGIPASLTTYPGDEPAESGIETGPLPEYATTLATALGVSSDDVDTLAQASTGVDASQIADLAMGADPTEIIRDELQGALEDAMKNIMQGAIESAVSAAGVEIQKTVDSNTGVAELAVHADEAEAYAQKLKQIKQQVSTDFTNYLVQTAAMHEQTLADLQLQIDAIEQNVIDGVDELSAEAQGRLDILQANKDALRIQLVDQLADYFLQSMDRHSGYLLNTSDLGGRGPVREFADDILSDYLKNGATGLAQKLENFLPW